MCISKCVCVFINDVLNVSCVFSCFDVDACFDDDDMCFLKCVARVFHMSRVMMMMMCLSRLVDDVRVCLSRVARVRRYFFS